VPVESRILPLRTENDVVQVRQVVREICQQMKFSLVDQTKFITAASELARNTVIHGKGGDMELQVLTSGLRSGLRLAFFDSGPGIPDIALAMKDGYTTGSGMGLGLSGAKRLSDEFTIESQPGKGTRVTITRWKR
jgi:serine/threonine-protein kinase RsbT